MLAGIILRALEETRREDRKEFNASANILAAEVNENAARAEAAEREVEVARKWSTRWKALAEFRGWPASRHEQNRRLIERLRIQLKASAAVIARMAG